MLLPLTMLTACGIGDRTPGETVANETPVVSEGNYVESWCATTSKGFRIFTGGRGSSYNITVIQDQTCGAGR
jgi:hypothetical protein